MLSLEIPSDLVQQRTWLETRLVSDDFSDFVAELRAARSVTHTGESVGRTGHDLENIFGSQVEVWASDGLGAMSERELEQLLSDPDLLLSLQYRIFAQGGDYWKPLMDQAINHHLDRAGTVHLEDNPQTPGGRSWIVIGLAASLLAAVILIPKMKMNAPVDLASNGVAVPGAQAENTDVDNGTNFFDPDTMIASTGWGWTEATAPRSFASGAEYLQWVASGAEAWFKKDVDSAVQYGMRLSELRAGCQQLLESEHPALTKDQATFLVARCMEWQSKFDRHAEQLDANPEDFATLKLKTDQAIRNAIAVLNEMQTNASV